MSTEVRRTIETVWRMESARLIAGLARITRDVGHAEELAQDGLVTALEQWPAAFRMRGSCMRARRVDREHDVGGALTPSASPMAASPALCSGMVGSCVSIERPDPDQIHDHRSVAINQPAPKPYPVPQRTCSLTPGDVADAIEDSQILELKRKSSDSYQVKVCNLALDRVSNDVL